MHSNRLSVLAVVVVLQGCVVVPKTQEYYDADCQIYARRMTLSAEAARIVINPCGGAECVAQLVSAGIVGAATAVVSGSIVIVGNTVYWFEKQGRCNRVDPENRAVPEQPRSAQILDDKQRQAGIWWAARI